MERYYRGSKGQKAVHASTMAGDKGHYCVRRSLYPVLRWGAMGRGIYVSANLPSLHQTKKLAHKIYYIIHLTFVPIEQNAMNFLKNILKSIKKETSKGAFFNLTEYEMKNLLCGIGKSKIAENEIEISDYPFEPSIAYPNKTIKANEIDAMSVDFGVCKVYVTNDIIFVSAEKKEELKKFAERNNIKLTEHSWNWDWILEPYLDTEFTQENEQRVLKRLEENGIEKQEVDQIRAEVGEQMYKYNFDTMLWDWCSLGLTDVLSAMRAKYDKSKFRDFYKIAIEIDKRKKTRTHNKNVYKQ